MKVGKRSLERSLHTKAGQKCPLRSGLLLQQQQQQQPQQQLLLLYNIAIGWEEHCQKMQIAIA